MAGLFLFLSFFLFLRNWRKNSPATQRYRCGAGVAEFFDSHFSFNSENNRYRYHNLFIINRRNCHHHWKLSPFFLTINQSVIVWYWCQIETRSQTTQVEHAETRAIISLHSKNTFHCVHRNASSNKLPQSKTKNHPYGRFSVWSYNHRSLSAVVYIFISPPHHTCRLSVS